MNPLDRFIPIPRMLEVDHVDLAISPERAWKIVRHTNLAGSPLVRALFALRAVPARLTGSDVAPLLLRLDDLVSTPDSPGFQILADEARSVVVGAVGKVWKLDIPFRHVAPDAYAAMNDPDWVKVAWALHVTPLGERDCRVTFEVRVDATSDVAWRRFQRYFRVIGPGSHFIRHSLLGALAREHGTPDAYESARPLEGDALVEDATAQVTHGITIAAPPERIWPWLIQLGCATPKGKDGFEVLAIDENRALVLGGLFDPEARKQLPFHSQRPEKFWQTTWSFVLEPLDADHTRVHVRGRAAFPKTGHLHTGWMSAVHHFMQVKQLQNLAARVEGRMPRDDWRDVLDGAGGAAIMLAALLTPFLRFARSHWGIDERDAARTYPGDQLVTEPRWMWTHGIEIDAPAEDVWPWIAQIGADHAGFYSYQWLENLAGCNVRNAETVHPDWENHLGGALILHPKAPALAIEDLVKGEWFVAHGRPDPRLDDLRWVEASWLFLVEPLGPRRCRFISRYRVAMSDDLATQLQFGRAVMEPIGFAMDRRMLLGVKSRVEAQRRVA